MAEATQTPSIRPLSHWMRWLLYTASGLVFLAGFQLIAFTEQTDRYFAWTIQQPYLTAAFLGAAYWSAVPVEVIAARQHTWAQARIAVPAVWLFTTLTLIATSLHFDRFHFFSPDVIAMGATWFWLAIYAGVPIAMLLAIIMQLRIFGGESVRVKTLPAGLRLTFLIHGAGMLIVGLALFVAPSSAIPLWPWVLTPLTARAAGAWFLSIGVAALHAIRENDFFRIRPSGGGYTAFAVLQLVALARYPGDIDWSLPAAWIYVLFLASVLPVGLYSWFGHREQK